MQESAMKRIRYAVPIVAILLVLLCTACACSRLQAPDFGRTTVYIDPSSGDGFSDAEIVAHNTVPATVRLKATLSNDQQTAGTAFFINKDGYLLTNRHCVTSGDAPPYPKPKDLYYIANGNRYDLEIVAISNDRDLDLALLRIRNFVGESPYIPFSDAVENPLAQDDDTILRYGQPCYAIGNPEDLGVTFARAMISNPYYLESDSVGNPIGKPDLLLDCNINHGNSGGPLVGADSKLVGVVYARMESDGNKINNVYGIGCAIPCYRVVAFLQTIAMQTPNGQPFYYEYDPPQA